MAEFDLGYVVGPRGLKGDKGDTGEKGEKGDKGDTNDIANNVIMHVAETTNDGTFDLVFSGLASSTQATSTTYRCRTTQNSNALTYQPSTGNLNCAGNINAAKVFNAVFNDYAEFRLCDSEIKAGYIVTEDEKNCDKVKICTTKNPKGKVFVVSDTYGTCMGDNKNSVAVALAGRALVYCAKKERIKVGDFIACGKDGKAKKISRLTAWFNPRKVLGTVSSIPTYDEWGTSKVKIDGRIWINIK